MDLRETVCEDIGWTELAEDMVHGELNVNMVMNLWVL
jgi:hypothetical protein